MCTNGRLFFPTRVLHRSLYDLAHSEHKGFGGAHNAAAAEGSHGCKREVLSSVFKTRTLRKRLICIPYVDATAANSPLHSITQQQQSITQDSSSLPVGQLFHVCFLELSILQGPFPRRLQHADAFRDTSRELCRSLIVLRESSENDKNKAVKQQSAIAEMLGVRVACVQVQASQIAHDRHAG